MITLLLTIFAFYLVLILIFYRSAKRQTEQRIQRLQDTRDYVTMKLITEHKSGIK